MSTHKAVQVVRVGKTPIRMQIEGQVPIVLVPAENRRVRTESKRRSATEAYPDTYAAKGEA